MDADQEWCLECGAARTIIARPPDWRVPLLVIGTVVLIIAAGVIFAVSQLGSNAGKVTLVNTTAARSSSSIGAWQTGLDGYTVILGAASTQAAARGEATKLLAAHVAHVGVLQASQHPQLHPDDGAWVVFADRYPTYATAKAAAARVARGGQPQAVPALVQRPGQG